MLLQIIDKPTPDSQNHLIEIKLTAGNQTQSFVTPYFLSAFPESLRKDLNGYFKNYLLAPPTAGADKNILDRLLAHGKYMGDRLLGEDLQLMSYREEIEDYGYNKLSVSIESSRISFFEEPWETLILPDSKYILSSVVSGFTRRFTHIAPIRSESVLEYALSKESPLKILHIMQPHHSETAGAAYLTANNLFQYDGNIDYELWPAHNWQALQARLSPTSNPVHILQYDGPIIYRSGMLYLTETTTEEYTTDHPTDISLLGLIEHLKNVKCGLLILNASVWLNDNQPLSADTGLALAAQIALTAGMPNILGFSNPTDPWTIEQILNALYKRICGGQILAQAIVETRKDLQTKIESNTLSLTTVPFQSWPLPIHYALQTVTFFSAPQAATNDLLQTQSYAAIRQKMHGFYSEFLPPYLLTSGDSVLTECLRTHKTDEGTILHIQGHQGTGKTQLLHMLAFYLMRRQPQQAFYFDYSEHFYTASDIQQMIEPILNKDSDSAQKKNSAHYIFALDNLDSALPYLGISNDQRITLEQYLETLKTAKYTVVITGNNTTTSLSAEFAAIAIRIQLPALNLIEQRHMASQLIRDHKIETQEHHTTIITLLEQCRGNPFLIKQIIPKFSTASNAQLIEQTKNLFTETQVQNCVTLYYQWQWQALPLTWQRWLVLLVDLSGVILEMLAIAGHSKKPEAPAAKLQAMLGETDKNFSEGINLLEKAGFTLQYPLGKVINPRCINFIKNNAKQDSFITEHKPELSKLISRMVCHAIAQVIPEAIKKSNQLLTQNLLANRGQWAKHMETIWQAGEHEEFSTSLTPLAELLKQNRLTEELAEWSLHILSDTNQYEFNTNIIAAPYLQNLIKLASLALLKEKSAQSQPLRNIAASADQWIKTLTSEQIEQHAALFTSMTQFLEMYYRQTKQWDTLQTICEIALREFQQHRVWPLIVTTLNTLADCAYAQKNTAQAQKHEQQLLNDIPYDQFPSGFEWQLKTRIITNRLIWEEYAAAQTLLDQVRASAEAEYQHNLLDMFQADIYYKQEKLEAAALLYHSLAESTAGQSSTANREFLTQRLADIKTRLGAEKYTTAIQEVAADT